MVFLPYKLKTHCARCAHARHQLSRVTDSDFELDIRFSSHLRRLRPGLPQSPSQMRIRWRLALLPLNRGRQRAKSADVHHIQFAGFERPES